MVFMIVYTYLILISVMEKLNNLIIYYISIINNINLSFKGDKQMKNTIRKTLATLLTVISVVTLLAVPTTNTYASMFTEDGDESYCICTSLATNAIPSYGQITIVIMLVSTNRLYDSYITVDDPSGCLDIISYDSTLMPPPSAEYNYQSNCQITVNTKCIEGVIYLTGHFTANDGSGIYRESTYAINVINDSRATDPTPHEVYPIYSGNPQVAYQEPAQQPSYDTPEPTYTEIGNVKLEKSIFQYTGEEINPEVVAVYDVNGNEISSDSYSVSYSDNIDTGVGSVTVEAFGNYTGSITTEFTIASEEEMVEIVDKMDKLINDITSSTEDEELPATVVVEETVVIEIPTLSKLVNF